MEEKGKVVNMMNSMVCCLQSCSLTRMTCHGGMILLLLCAAQERFARAQAFSLSPPATRQDTVKELIHGVEIVDPYRWLEDQESLETRQWIDTQNRYAHRLLDSLPSRERLVTRLTSLVQINRLKPPIERNGRYFIFRKSATDDLWTLYFRTGLNGEDQVLIDPHSLSSDHTTDISLEDISLDGTLMVYGVRRGGEDETELRVMDVESRKDFPDTLPRGLYYGVSLKPDNSGFYYTHVKRGSGPLVYYHALGDTFAVDEEIFGKGYGGDAWVSGTVSENGRYLTLQVQYGWARTDVYVKNIEKRGPITQIGKGVDATFFPWFAGDVLTMQTNWDASNGRIVALDPEKPGAADWREIVPSGPDAISEFALVGGKLVVHYVHNASSVLKVYTLEGRALGEIALPGLGTTSGLSGRWDNNELFFDFTSFIMPRTTYRYSMKDGVLEVWSRDEVPFVSDKYEVHQIWYTSRDGTKVPMFLVHAKGLKRDGRQPTLLYGYGGFNVSLTPSFSSMVAAWLEEGGVYALANIRGGGEFGEEWHRAGMLDKKQNVFDDFIAAAECLITNRYTDPSRLAIRGGSNGGLLVGAALTQRPDLYQAVLCEFPDLDMVGYYRFKNINVPALLEYGNASDPEQFKYLFAYSPYQRVKGGTNYPAVLLMTGDADTRVPPLQARKMTARLQAASASGRPVLLLYDTKAGHSGCRPQRKIVEDAALELAFLCWQLGIDHAQ
jgi:prolyl oligopeptidase